MFTKQIPYGKLHTLCSTFYGNFVGILRKRKVSTEFQAFLHGFTKFLHQHIDEISVLFAVYKDVSCKSSLINTCFSFFQVL